VEPGYGREPRVDGAPGQVIGAQALSDGRVLSWSRDATLRVWDLATGESRALTGHDALVEGAQLLPDGRVLSRSHDWSIRLWDIDGTRPTLAFYFDATPTVALPYDHQSRLFVGDALGRVHFLEILG
jgi:WD40 repeat protein